jgi:hypothetical protein
VSHVHTAKATSKEIAMRTDDRVGGRRTITASSWQQHPTPALRCARFTIRLIVMVRLAR